MRYLCLLSICLSTLVFVGCPLVKDPVEPVVAAVNSPEPIDQLVARTLEENRTQRQLSSTVHGAWQILHGVLAYGDQLLIETPEGKKPALEYLLEGNPVSGFEPQPGDKIGVPPRVGLRMAMQATTKIGQGHRDQWLAVISQCGLPAETELNAGQQTFTLEDWLRQMEYDVPRNLEHEFSWTLIALTTYRDTDHIWSARDGYQYSTASLLESELDKSLPSSVCGGTHRLIGIAMSLDKRRREGRPITGVWADAAATVNQSVQDAKQNQNADGSYSTAYLHRPGLTRDLGELLGTTGHVLEFLAFAAPDETLAEPWVERSVRRLCQVLDECREVDLECGVLYHALHGLNQYQHRMSQIGPRS